MNLIIFVLSLIMILAAMTYTRFESFSKSHLQSQEWVSLLQDSQRDLYNQQQKKCRLKKRAKKSEPTDKQTKGKTPGSGKIPLAWLLGKSEHQKEVQELIESLITCLWSDQPFYKRLAKERPQFVEALLQDILNTSSKITDEKEAIKNLDQLMVTNWNDLELKTAFGRMLQDGLVYDKKNIRNDGSPDLTYKSPKGFQSLRDYFTNQKTDKIRVWLAPRALLGAIFRDPQVVEEVINLRKELYGQVKKKGSDADALSKQFEETFSSKTSYKDLLDWQVTMTDVRNR